MYAVTRTGTTVKSFQNDVKSVTSGSNLGIIIPPLINFMIEIPIVMTRNTTASATDKAEVNLKESATTTETKSTVFRASQFIKYGEKKSKESSDDVCYQ